MANETGDLRMLWRLGVARCAQALRASGNGGRMSLEAREADRLWQRAEYTYRAADYQATLDYLLTTECQPWYQNSPRQTR